MASWLGDIVSFVEKPANAQVRADLWVAVGVEGDLADTLAELGLLFRGGRLEIDCRHAHDPDLFQTIRGSLLHLWQVVRFSDSRWVTVGKSCRTLTAALLIGVGSLVASVIANPKMSNYHIGGFKRLGKRETMFVIMVAVCSYPSDAVLCSLTEDDRVAHRRRFGGDCPRGARLGVPLGFGGVEPSRVVVQL